MFFSRALSDPCFDAAGMENVKLMTRQLFNTFFILKINEANATFYAFFGNQSFSLFLWLGSCCSLLLCEGQLIYLVSLLDLFIIHKSKFSHLCVFNSFVFINLKMQEFRLSLNSLDIMLYLAILNYSNIIVIILEATPWANFFYIN